MKASIAVPFLLGGYFLNGGFGSLTASLPPGGGPPPAPPAFVQMAQNSSSSTGPASVSAAFSTSNTSGNLIFYFILFDNNQGGTIGQPVFTVSDSKGNTYTKIASNYDPTTENGEYSEIGYAKNIGGGANTIQVAISGTVSTGYYLAVMGAEFSGFSTSAPFTSGEFSFQNQNPAPTTTDGVTSLATPTLSSAPKVAIGVTGLKHNLLGTSWLQSGTGYTNDGTFWTFGFPGNIFAMLEHKTASTTAGVAATFTQNNGVVNLDTYVAVFSQ